MGESEFTLNSQIIPEKLIGALTDNPGFHTASALFASSESSSPPNLPFTLSEMMKGAFEAAIVKFAFEIHDLHDCDSWQPAEILEQSAFDSIPLSSILELLDRTQPFYLAFDHYLLPSFRDYLSQSFLFGHLILARLFGSELINFNDFESVGRKILAREHERRQLISQANANYHQRTKEMPNLVRHFVGLLISKEFCNVCRGEEERTISSPDWHYSRIHRILTNVLKSFRDHILTDVLSGSFRELSDGVIRDLVNPKFGAASQVMEQAVKCDEYPLIALLKWLETKKITKAKKSQTNQTDISYWPNAIMGDMINEFQKRGNSEVPTDFSDKETHELKSPWHPLARDPTALPLRWPTKSRESEMIRELDNLIGVKRRQVFLIRLRLILDGNEDPTQKAMAASIGMSPASFSEYKKKNERDGHQIESIVHAYFFDNLATG